MKTSICLLICLISFVNCSLHSICKNDTLEYGSSLVNGFYKIQKQIKYGPTEDYKLSVNLTDVEMKWEEKIELDGEILKYDVNDFYWFYHPVSSIHFNSTWLEEMKQMFQDHKDKIIMIRDKYNNENAKPIYDQILMKMDKPIKMIDELMPIGKNLLEQNLMSKEEIKKYLNNRLIKLRVKNFPLDLESYYKYELVKLNQFKFDENNNGVFVVDIFLPVERRKFTRIPIFERCVPVKDVRTGQYNLPPFFQKVHIF